MPLILGKAVIMGITRLKRKARRNKQTASKRNSSIKHLTATPVIKNIDREALIASFPVTEAPVEAKAAPKAKAEKGAKAPKAEVVVEETAAVVEEAPKAEKKPKAKKAPKKKAEASEEAASETAE